MLNLQRFEIKGHKGESEYGLSRNDIPDYDLYPDSEFITFDQWENFRRETSFPYWLSFEEVIVELVCGVEPYAYGITDDAELIDLIDNNEELAEEIRYND